MSIARRVWYTLLHQLLDVNPVDMVRGRIKEEMGEMAEAKVGSLPSVDERGEDGKSLDSTARAQVSKDYYVASLHPTASVPPLQSHA